MKSTSQLNITGRIIINATNVAATYGIPFLFVFVNTLGSHPSSAAGAIISEYAD